MNPFQEIHKKIAGMYPNYTINVLEMGEEPGCLLVRIFGVEAKNKRSVRKAIIQVSSEIEYTLLPIIFDMEDTLTSYPEVYAGMLLGSLEKKLYLQGSM